jgi:hypothetical protein
VTYLADTSAVWRLLRGQITAWPWSTWTTTSLPSRRADLTCP